ncbi:MAG: hypothetical protein QM726_24605 [Chitinophagaceae bacterium]
MKKLLILLLALGSLLNVHAQDGEKLQALKIAYLTKKLDLSPEEAQRFWPVYNKYTEEIKAVRLGRKQTDNPESELEIEEKVLAVRKKYNGEFAKALSPEKVNTFFRSEKDFGLMIQRELQERRMNRQLNRRGLRD